jgi:hypothetical protein
MRGVWLHPLLVPSAFCVPDIGSSYQPLAHFRVQSTTVNGDKASITVIKEGLKTPTGVEPAGDTIWVSERGTGKAVSILMPK